MTIPTLTTANTFGEMVNDTQQLITLMNALTDGPQVNANTTLVITKIIVSNLVSTQVVTLNSYANAAYDHANGAFAAANIAAANTTNANIRSKFSNTAPVNYDSTNGIFSLASSGVGATTYGNTTFVASFTVDAFGRITSASNVAITYTGARSVFANTTPINYDSSTR